MGDAYDINVEYDTLCRVADKLQYISHDLQSATDQMNDAMRRSEHFLAGNQFEKAKNTTRACTELTNRTHGNLAHAMDFISKLKAALEEYGRCGYNGE